MCRRGSDHQHVVTVYEVGLHQVLIFVAMAVFQIGLALYIRNTLISAASEGARYGARADSSQSLGVDRTKALIREGLSRTYADQVSSRESTIDGLAVVEVTVQAPLPVMGLLGPTGMMTVSGRAFNERQVTQVSP